MFLWLKVSHDVFHPQWKQLKNKWGHEWKAENNVRNFTLLCYKVLSSVSRKSFLPHVQANILRTQILQETFQMFQMDFLLNTFEDYS